MRGDGGRRPAPPPAHASTRARGRLVLGLALCLLALGCARARDAEIAPSSGAVLYARYCASCHGPEGRGDGPAAAALTPPPTDLTRSSADIPALMHTIDGRRTIRAHGSAAMPVWGEVFEGERADEPYRRRTALQDAQALAEYVHALQRAP